MKKRTQMLAVLAVLLISVAAAIGFFASTLVLGPKFENPAPGYLSYNGNPSKIYLVSSTVLESNANQTYIAADGQVIGKGSPLFTMAVTLRNDYSPDDPAPPVTSQVAPVDGAAYVCLSAQLINNQGVINGSVISTGDFYAPSIQGTALVLAAGQTVSASIYYWTDQADVNGFRINLNFLGDSVPLS